MRLTTIPLHLVSFAVNFSTSNDFVRGSSLFSISFTHAVFVFFCLSACGAVAAFALFFFFWFAIFMPSVQFPSL